MVFFKEFFKTLILKTNQQTTKQSEKLPSMQWANVFSVLYFSYAIMYSCWEEFANGACKPQNTYVVVLQRSTAKLPADKKQEIDQAIRDVCIEPKVLKSIQHYGYCPKERENL